MTVAVESVIERLGGAEAAARLTGVGTEAIRKWRQAGAMSASGSQTSLAIPVHDSTEAVAGMTPTMV